jgi:adenylosuccinate synthase
MAARAGARNLGGRSLGAPFRIWGFFRHSRAGIRRDIDVPNWVVCGVNWGDEGKGRMVDYLAEDADVVVRYQGGNNAGHTVVNEHGTFKLHLIPSGIFRPAVRNVLGPGMVIDIESFCEELDALASGGLTVDKIYISDRATISFPFYRDEDTFEEERLGAKAYGSTKRGIAPAYGDRYLKKSILVGELRDMAHFRERLRAVYEWKRLVSEGVYSRKPTQSYEQVLAWSEKYGQRILPKIVDTTELLEDEYRKGSTILFEAQLGALRDVYYGVYPFTSSSCALAAFAPIGSGLLGRPIERVIGVMKAFSTCVGEGPFVTEMHGDVANSLRETALEYGAATGRPRRIGHFDAVASRYGAYLQGVTEVALTKLDSLSGQKKLKICDAYEIGGRASNAFPLNHELEKAKPRYIELDGWSEDISACRKYAELPTHAKRYVAKIEELINARLRYISVGPRRDQLIVL